MHFRSRFLLALSFAGLSWSAPLAAQEPTAPPPDPGAEQMLGLDRALEVRVAARRTSGGTVLAVVDPGLVIELAPHSVRSPSYRVLAQRADGSIESVRPGPVRTLRGRVLNLPGSFVTGALLDDGLHLRLWTGAGEELWLQPMDPLVAGIDEGIHVLYRGSDAARSALGCGTGLLANARPVPLAPRGGAGHGSSQESATRVAELACDADFEFYSSYGSSNAVADRIELVINAMNTQYARDVDIEHTITTILVRTSSNQPYTSTDAVDLLYQFRDHWNANHSGVARDVAQLFTGKEIDGGTIGIAWVGVVCNLQYAYSVVQSDFNNNFGCATDLSAHELGHSWSADHCGCTSYTMNSFITCANQFHPSQSIPEITAFRDSLSCLGSGGGGSGGTATSVAASVEALVVNIGRGNKQGQAVVTVTDDLGAPVQGAAVTGDFSGSINETGVMDTTDANGMVTLKTSSTARGGVSITFCVTDVTAALPWSQQPPPCDSN